MPLWAASYRLGRRLVGKLPPWLLRVRPVDVFEIVLSDHGATAASTGATGRDSPGDERIAWIAASAEAEALGSLAGAANKAAFDGNTLRAAAVWQGDRPIACVWIARGCYEEPDVHVRYELAEDEAWLLAAAVAPEHRRRGVYRRLLGFVLPELAAAGTRRILLAVVCGNHASASVHQQLGARRIGRIAAVRALGATMTRGGGAVRPAGCCVAREAVTIRLN